MREQCHEEMITRSLIKFIGQISLQLTTAYP
jgi:hypothetical protein